MSYEGYTEYLCENGHHWTVDVMNEADECLCPRCKGIPVWDHGVNETNGIVEDENGVPDPDTVPYPLEVERYEEVVVKMPVYKIPANTG